MKARHMKKEMDLGFIIMTIALIMIFGFIIISSLMQNVKSNQIVEKYVTVNYGIDAEIESYYAYGYDGYMITLTNGEHVHMTKEMVAMYE